MSDEKFEEFLQREARSYNEPPHSIPRDEMFAAITAGRKTEAGRPKPDDRGWKIEDGRSRPRLAWIGMAATLVIGVAIGRYALARHDSTAPGSLASAPRNGVPAASAPQRADSSAGSYTLAATEQLTRAEALLTAYGASGADAQLDKQMSAWARDLLSNTRLLLDSPAANDPSRKRLLQDLELVLVQMVQRSPAAGAAEERAHIDRSIERTQVLPRLRSALPAGRNSGI